MTTEKKARKMSAKGFLTKSNSNKATTAAMGFLAAHREYLLTGEVSYSTAPIVEAFDKGELIASVALQEVKNAVLAHVMELDRLAAEEALEKGDSPSGDSKKHFLAEIRDASTGNLCLREKEDGTMEKLSKRFPMPQDAERWVDRRLFDGCPSWYGTVTQTNALHPEHATDVIERVDAIARILKKPRNSVTKSNKYSGGGLGFGVKVHEKPVKFSRG